MTSTETESPAEDAPDAPPEDAAGTPPGGEPPAEPPALDAGPDPRREALLTRGILPLALPFLAALGTGIWVRNLSRAFLAGGKQGALVIVLITTVSIMAGAALMSAAPRMRDSSRLMVVAGFATFIVVTGIVTLGFSEEKSGGGGGYKPPKGPAVAAITVDALPSIKFNSTTFTTKAGVNQIDYVGKGGTHTLVFTDPKLTGFQLNVSTGKTDHGKVDLKPGTYTIYCSVDGHRSQGMQATITVT
jgi:plastocyanin